MSYVLGIDIGGTKLAVTLACAEGDEIELLQKEKLPTPRDGAYQPALEQLIAVCLDLLRREKLRTQEISGVGISCGGPLDSERGLILSPPNLIGWDEVPVTQFFEERLGVPARLQNDADACALAEWRFGAGRGCRNMVFLTFGTGFGAGLILDGKLYSGTNGMAGEIGHCRSPYLDATRWAPSGYGKTGSFEGFCSGAGIAELGRMVALESLQRGEPAGFCKTLQDLNALDAKRIGDAAEAGDPAALEVYRCSGRNLGAALSLLVDLLNPQRIVIGSIYARCTALLRDAALEVLCKEALPSSRSVCEIVPAALGERLGDVSALSIALTAGQA